MQRRPWPLVVLAVLQFLTPIASLILSAYLNSVSIGVMAEAIWSGSSAWKLFEFYLAPILGGVLILHARAWGFLLVISYSAWIAWKNYLDWHSSDQIGIKLLLYVVMLLALGLVAYLFMPKVRAIYFDKKLRWWETKPRYLVNLEGQVRVISTPTELSPFPITILDLSVGGAGMDSGMMIPMNERVEATFRFNEESYVLHGVVVYGRAHATSFRFGVEWYFESQQNRLKYQELISYLKRQKYPETRKVPDWQTDLRSWAQEAKRNPKAWIPNTPLPQASKGKSETDPK